LTLAYATTDELHQALRKTKPFTPEEEVFAQQCLDAAAEEIDAAVDRLDVMPPDDPLANRVCLLRGVEWWKANDAAFGVIGFDQTGAVRAPRDSFARHESALLPLKQQWGVA
jgi:hypothetical protein